MFKIIKKSKKDNSRIVRFSTKSGVIETPFFMPDATRGYIKSLSKKDLNNIKIDPMVVNTYHLFLSPGMKIVKKAGGIHRFMNWDKPLLSDSGGYQVFSLVHKNPKMGRITDEGVVFRSPLDGSLHKITPEKSIQIQFDLGVDMMVCFDDPPPNDSGKKQIKEAVERTIAWAKRCRKEYDKQVKKRKLTNKNKPLIFGVIQGGSFIDLRKYCAEELVKIGFHGYGFGARHIDKKGKFMTEVLKKTASFIPEDSLRFALGVGKPEDIIKCIPMGWDMFDCVIPTREARHGRIYIKVKSDLSADLSPAGIDKAGKLKVKSIKYKVLNIKNAKFKGNLKTVDKNCQCELCQNYSLGYLHHLFKMNENLGQRLVSIHNLKFYLDLLQRVKANI